MRYLALLVLVACSPRSAPAPASTSPAATAPRATAAPAAYQESTCSSDADCVLVNARTCGCSCSEAIPKADEAHYLAEARERDRVTCARMRAANITIDCTACPARFARCNDRGRCVTQSVDAPVVSGPR